MWEKIVRKFIDGCEDGALVLQDATPIDTMRLYASTRVEIEDIGESHITVHIVQGGVELHGILREQELSKPVDYGFYVVARNNYIRSNIDEIRAAIQKSMVK